METNIAILDYGMGNRRSVEKAFRRVGASVSITADHEELLAADGLVIVGVGAFPEAMRRFTDRGMLEPLRERLQLGRPILGICLGLQLFFERSEEHEGASGLGFLEGNVRRLPSDGLKVPHIAWSPVEWAARSELSSGIAAEDSIYYHLHSFASLDTEMPWVTGTAGYGRRFVTAIEEPPLYGVQFHPEKSSKQGLRLLENFTGICARAGVAG